MSFPCKHGDKSKLKAMDALSAVCVNIEQSDLVGKVRTARGTKKFRAAHILFVDNDAALGWPRETIPGTSTCSRDAIKCYLTEPVPLGGCRLDAGTESSFQIHFHRCAHPLCCKHCGSGPSAGWSVVQRTA